MSDPFKVACIQTNSGSDVAANLAAAVDLVRQARSAGADLIALHPQAHWSDDDAEQAVGEDICGPAALAACAVGHVHGRDAFLRV